MSRMALLFFIRCVPDSLCNPNRVLNLILRSSGKSPVFALAAARAAAAAETSADECLQQPVETVDGSAEGSVKGGSVAQSRRDCGRGYARTVTQITVPEPTSRSLAIRKPHSRREWATGDR
jgi:hypothetical protein